VTPSLRLALATLGFSLLRVGAATGAAQGSAGCAPVDSVTIDVHRDYLLALAVDGDSLAIAGREAFELERADSSMVVFVSDSALCLAAAAAVNVPAGTPGRSRLVWVYRLGDAFAVEDPSLRGNPEVYEYPFYLFDSRWKPKPILMY
jgi:hypothetical protein